MQIHPSYHLAGVSPLPLGVGYLMTAPAQLLTLDIGYLLMVPLLTLHMGYFFLAAPELQSRRSPLEKGMASHFSILALRTHAQYEKEKR